MSDLMGLVGIVGVLEIRMMLEQCPADEFADHQGAIEELQQLVPLATENTAESFDKKAKLASLYMQVGLYVQAVPLLTEILDARRNLLGWNHPATIQIQEFLACALYAKGQPTDALEHFEAAGASRSRYSGTEDGLTVQTMFNKGVVTWQTGKHQEACGILNDTYKLSEQVHGLNHTGTLSAMENLSFMYHFAGRSWEAQKVQQKVVNLRLHDLPRDDSSLLKSAILLGKIYMDMEWWRDCEKTYDLIVELRTNLQGTDSPATLASRANLATAVQRQGRFDEAEKICSEISDVSQTKFGPESPIAMRSRLHIARILGDKGKHMEALMIQQTILQSQEELLGHSHGDTCSTLTSLSDTLMALKNYNEAIAVSKKLVSALEQRLGGCHLETLSARLDLAMLLARIEVIDETEETVLNVISDCQGAQEGSELAPKLREAVNILLQHGRSAAFNKFYFGL